MSDPTYKPLTNFIYYLILLLLFLLHSFWRVEGPIIHLCPIKISPHHPPRIFVEYHHVPGMWIIMYNTGLMDLPYNMDKSFRTFLGVGVQPEYPHVRDVLQEDGVGGILLIPKRSEERLPELEVNVLNETMVFGDKTPIT